MGLKDVVKRRTDLLEKGFPIRDQGNTQKRLEGGVSRRWNKSKSVISRMGSNK